MTQYACFLRGINVGGKNKIKMAELKALLSGLGLSNPQTLLQSGNALFEAKGSATSLEKKICAAIEKSHGFAPAIMLRTLDGLKASLAANPFKKEAKADPAHLLIMFLAGKPKADAKKALAALDIAPEAVSLGDREAYLWYPHGIGTSKKLARVPLEKILGVSGTARNIRTIEALLELAG